VEAEAGAMFAFEEGETYPAFAGGISTGWRFMFGQKQEAKSRFYLEPAIRFGYPHIWGAGIMAGFSIPLGTRKKQADEQKAEEIKI